MNSFRTPGNPKALTSTTIYMGCGTKNNSEEQEHYILIHPIPTLSSFILFLHYYPDSSYSYIITQQPIPTLLS